MAEFITMPRLSDTMTEGTVIKWHKKIGEKISEGDLLAEIETDKAIQEFESDFNGFLLYIGIPEGKSAKVDSLLAVIGESINLDINSILSSYDNEKRDIITSSSDNEKRLFVSPLAKIMAKNKSIPLENIKGSGTNGRIIKRDIETYKVEISNKFNTFSTILNSNEVINSSIRKVIAKRLTESKFTAPHYYLMVEVDMDNFIESKININKNLKEENKISYNDIIIKAAALSLRDNPKINSSWKNDITIYHSNIHIGVAVAVEDGLFVPVIKHADKKTLLQISLEVKEKTRKAKMRKISQEEMKGSTFTISNLGMFGIESFTSIINQPNSCILSVGTILKKPIIKNDKIDTGNIMKLTLACDHRIVDGVIGSTYLQSIKKYLEDPIIMIL
jgi:pyruvate dehydrogenase E2 component (dihydrolipoamide acetyltransferase)